VELHFEAYGQGKPLIILHGLLGSMDNFRSVSLTLSAHFKVFGLDLRNHGRSPHSPDMDYSLMAQDVQSFIERQSIREICVLGHSMGGKVAMQLALLYPESVSKLIVADIAPHSYPPRHRKILEGMVSLDLGHFQSRKEIEAALAPAVPNLATRQFLLKNAVRDSSGPFHWRIGLQEIIRNYPRLTQAITSGRSFDKQALFIRGQSSDYLLEDDMVSIRTLFPRARLTTIPGAGHLVHTENLAAFLNAIQDFLQEP
jgi:esterase